MLVIGVGIMYQQSYLIFHTDYGFDKDEVMVVPTAPDTRNHADAIDADLRLIPGIEGASLAQNVLGSDDRYQTWGRGEGDKHMTFACIFVDWRFLQVMGIDIVEGRDFRETDGDVYIFNESAKKKYPWLALGKPINDEDMPVVGFCEDIKYSTLRVDDSEKPIAFLVPKRGGYYYENSYWRNVLMVRVAKGVDKREAKQKVLKTVLKYEHDNKLSVNDLRYMDDVLESSYQQERLFTKQILLFSLLAILISIIGVFGMTMFESEYRRKEIGIRTWLLRGCCPRRLLSWRALARRLRCPHAGLALALPCVVSAHRSHHHAHGDLPELEKRQRESCRQHQDGVTVG